jgi:hypothetical protein
VIAIVCDNASNNDTLVEALARYCTKEGIRFNAVEARLRCMPHTVHLSALKLLEGIGAYPKSNGRYNGNYQDSVTAPLSREHDDDAAMCEDEEEGGAEGEDEDEHPDGQAIEIILSALKKVGFVALSLTGVLVCCGKAPQDRSSCPFQPAKTSSMACRSKAVLAPNGASLDAYRPYANPGCEDSVVINSPDAAYVQFLQLSNILSPSNFVKDVPSTTKRLSTIL